MALAVAAQVRQVTEQISLVGAPDRYSHLGLPVVPDQVANAGPLAGIVAALEDSVKAHAIVVACDMPFLRPGLLTRLHETAVTKGAEAIVPRGPDGRPQPLCAVFAATAADPLSLALRDGVRKLTEAFARLNVVYLDPADYADVDRRGESFHNINTLADLRTAG